MKLVSACLAGFNCRWDGKSKSSHKIIQMIDRGEAIPVCPEQLGGLTTPRAPAEKRNGRILNKDEEDVTNQFNKGANEVLNIALLYGIDEFIGKQNSPSCGCGCIPNGYFSGKLIEGDGVTTSLLRENGFKVSAYEEK